VAKPAVTIKYLPSRRVTILEADLEEVTGLVAAGGMAIVIAKAFGTELMTELAVPALRTVEGVGRGVPLGVDTEAAGEM